VDTEFEIFGELFVEFLEIFCVFGDRLEHFHNLLDDVLLDYFQNFVVLQEFSRDVKGKILTVDNSFDE
jgi:hypothetical protein